jgi:hypothetical protein
MTAFEMSPLRRGEHGRGWWGRSQGFVNETEPESPVLGPGQGPEIAKNSELRRALPPEGLFPPNKVLG